MNLAFNASSDFLTGI